MPNKIILLNAGTPEKSVDGQGAPKTGTFVYNNQTYRNAILAGGAVYSSMGEFVAYVNEGTWTN